MRGGPLLTKMYIIKTAKHCVVSIAPLLCLTFFPLLSGCVATPESESLSSLSLSSSSSNPASSSVSSTMSSLQASSAGVSSSSDSSQPTVLTGKYYYEEHCQGCHNEDGKGFGQDLTELSGVKYPDMAALVSYNTAYMPKGNIDDCGSECSIKVSEYIVDTYMGERFGQLEPAACAQPEYLSRRLRRLTHWEYKLTTDMLLKLNAPEWVRLPTENRLHGFDNNADETLISSTFVDGYLDIAQSLSTRFDDAGKFSKFMQSYGDCLQGDECANTLVNQFLPLAFRRPITGEEFSRYRAFITDTSAQGLIEGAKSLVVAAFNSPHFLYRTELGNQQADGTYKLTPYETASWLSFTFLGRAPDQAIFTSATNGDFDSAEKALNRIQGFLGNFRIKPTVGRFGKMWLQVDSLADIGEKDTQVFSGYSAAVGISMVTEADRFFQAVVFEGEGQFSELYNADYTIANKTLADFYNLTLPDANNEGFQKTNTPNRHGWLTMGGSMAAHANATDTNPIERGIFVRTEMLCHDLPPVPRNIDIIVPERDTGKLARESFAEHSSAGECATCHYVIDDLGFALEQFNGAGVFRQNETNQLIDVTNLWVNDAQGIGSGIDEIINSPKDLAQHLAQSSSAKACFAKQFYRYAQGVGEVDDCTTDALTSKLELHDGSMIKMMFDVTQLPQFLIRQ